MSLATECALASSPFFLLVGACWIFDWGYRRGFKKGFSDGVDTEAVDARIRQFHADRKRRDRYGRFTLTHNQN
jgi:hypothetical protein